MTSEPDKLGDSHTISVFLSDEAATEALAQQFAPLLCGGCPGGRIHLRGELGTGKTSFARALLQACGITGRIKSPSYALIESYNLSSLLLYHLDFYRFSDTLEWLDAGFRDILHEDNVVLIEWPERAGEHLPAPDLDIQLKYATSGRHACLTAHTDRGKSWLKTIVFPAPD